MTKQSGKAKQAEVEKSRVLKTSADKSSPGSKTAGRPESLNGAIDSTAQLSPAEIAALQRTYGNHFLQRLGGAPAKREEGEKPLSLHVEKEIERKRGEGRPLPDEVQEQMEGRMGADFGDVRVHDDAGAGQLSQSLNADAFTTQQDIFFAEGKYAPHSDEGQKLLAHELTHVVQQGAARPKAKEEEAPDEETVEAAAEKPPEGGKTADSPTTLPAGGAGSQSDAKNQAEAAKAEKGGEAKEGDKGKGEKEKTPPAAEAKKKEEKAPDKEKEKQEKQEEKKKKAKKAGDPEAIKEKKFDPEAIPEPEAEAPLPTWDQLAAGTVSLAAVDTELEMHNQLVLGEEFGEQDAAGEELNRDELIGQAFAEGALTGFVGGLTSAATDQAMGLITNKIPYADGFIAMAQIATNPKKWFQENVLVIGQNAVKVAKSFGQLFQGFPLEDNWAGKLAAFLEMLVSLIDFVSSIVNLITTVLTILQALFWAMSFIPFVGPFFSALASAISPFLGPLGTVSTVLGTSKLLLSVLIIPLRAIDLKLTKGDTEKLLKKQAALTGHVQGTVSDVTARGVNYGAGKLQNKAQKSWDKRQARKKMAKAEREGWDTSTDPKKLAKYEEAQAKYEEAYGLSKAERDQLKGQHAGDKKALKKAEKKARVQKEADQLTQAAQDADAVLGDTSGRYSKAEKAKAKRDKARAEEDLKRHQQLYARDAQGQYTGKRGKGYGKTRSKEFFQTQFFGSTWRETKRTFQDAGPTTRYQDYKAKRDSAKREIEERQQIDASLGPNDPKRRQLEQINQAERNAKTAYEDAGTEVDTARQGRQDARSDYDGARRETKQAKQELANTESDVQQKEQRLQQKETAVADKEKSLQEARRRQREVEQESVPDDAPLSEKRTALQRKLEARQAVQRAQSDLDTARAERNTARTERNTARDNRDTKRNELNNKKQAERQKKDDWKQAKQTVKDKKKAQQQKKKELDDARATAFQKHRDDFEIVTDPQTGQETIRPKAKYFSRGSLKGYGKRLKGNFDWQGPVKGFDKGVGAGVLSTWGINPADLVKAAISDALEFRKPRVAVSVVYGGDLEVNEKLGFSPAITATVPRDEQGTDESSFSIKNYSTFVLPDRKMDYKIKAEDLGAETIANLGTDAAGNAREIKVDKIVQKQGALGGMATYSDNEYDGAGEHTLPGPHFGETDQVIIYYKPVENDNGEQFPLVNVSFTNKKETVDGGGIRAELEPGTGVQKGLPAGFTPNAKLTTDDQQGTETDFPLAGGHPSTVALQKGNGKYKIEANDVTFDGENFRVATIKRVDQFGFHQGDYNSGDEITGPGFGGIHHLVVEYEAPSNTEGKIYPLVNVKVHGLPDGADADVRFTRHKSGGGNDVKNMTGSGSFLLKEGDRFYKVRARDVTTSGGDDYVADAIKVDHDTKTSYDQSGALSFETTNGPEWGEAATVDIYYRPESAATVSPKMAPGESLRAAPGVVQRQAIDEEEAPLMDDEAEIEPVEGETAVSPPPSSDSVANSGDGAPPLDPTVLEPMMADMALEAQEQKISLGEYMADNQEEVAEQIAEIREEELEWAVSDEPEPVAEEMEEPEMEMEAEELGEEETPSIGDPTQLPPPPVEAMERMSATAVGYNELTAEEVDLKMQVKELGGLSKDAQSQQEEIAGGRAMVTANREAIGEHEEDIEVKKTAQDEAKAEAQAASGESDKADSETDIGQKIMSVILAPIMEIVNIGNQETDSQSDPEEMKKSESGASDISQGASGAAAGLKQGIGDIERQQGETKRAEAETRQEDKRLAGMERDLDAQEQDAAEGEEEMQELHDQQAEQLEVVGGEKERLAEEHALAIEEMEAWAEMHEEMRLELFDDVESELE